MTRRPRVSVIMPVLNAEAFIAEAIGSVLAQTYDAWELLVVDDGSTDMSPSIARRYAESHPDRIRHLAHHGVPHRGTSATLNLGIRHSRGELVAFLDADDVYLPTKLADQVAILDVQTDAAMVYADTLFWFSWTGRPEDRDRDFTPDLGVPRDRAIHPPRPLVLMLRQEAAVPCTCSVLVRRTALDEVGAFEESFTHVFTDQALYAKLFVRKTVYVASGCWDRYRQHSASSYATLKRSGARHVARLAFLNWLGRYLAAEGVSDRGVWVALRRARWSSRHPRLAQVLGRARHALRRLGLQ